MHVHVAHKPETQHSPRANICRVRSAERLVACLKASRDQPSYRSAEYVAFPLPARTAETAACHIHRILTAVYGARAYGVWIAAGTNPSRKIIARHFRRIIIETGEVSALTTSVPEHDRKLIFKAAVHNANSGRTLGATALLLHRMGLTGLTGGGAEAGLTGVGETELTRLRPSAAAAVVYFEAVSWLHQQLHVVDLGTQKVHETALRLRYGLSSTDELPHHIKQLCICCQCFRVCNARPIPFNRKSNQPGPQFGELGYEKVTWRDGRHGGSHVYCSRRCPSQDANSCRTAEVMMRTNFPPRLRKAALLSYSTPEPQSVCGSTPALQVDMLGKLIIFDGRNFSICSCCGVTFEVQAIHVTASAQIVCFSCELDSPKPKRRPAPQPICTLCDIIQGPTMQPFIELPAPHDVALHNQNKPTEGRSIHFCHQHNRKWLQNALQHLPTPQVLIAIATENPPSFFDLAHAQTAKRPRYRL